MTSVRMTPREPTCKTLETMANTLKFEIITPDETAYSADVDMVTLPGVEGQMGVFPQHVPLMTQMVPGEIIVRKDGRDYSLAVGEGLVEITGDHVAILTDLAIAAEKIDEAKVEEARRRAEARLRRSSPMKKSRRSTLRSPAPWRNCTSSAGNTTESKAAD